MAPNNKAVLIQLLRSNFNLTVAMCGDGANDCYAMKEAQVALSLSNAEASIAAPFTSSLFEISSMVVLLTEGRCALVTSFICFKWIAMQSMIQFITVQLLQVLETNISNMMFLWTDLCTVLPLVYFMAWSKPADKISKNKPPKRLLSSVIILSVLIQILICLGFQIAAYQIILADPKYKSINTLMDQRASSGNALQTIKDRNVSYETTAIFLVAQWQQIWTNILFNRGDEFKEPLLKNYWLVFWLILISAANLVLNLAWIPKVHDDIESFGLLKLTMDYRWQLVGLIAANLVANCIAELSILPAIMQFIGNDQEDEYGIESGASKDKVKEKPKEKTQDIIV